MKAFTLSICTLLLFSITACEDDTLSAGNDNPAVPENTYIWDNPHTSFFGLKGNVSNVHQQMINPVTGESEEAEDPFHVTDYSFDAKGNLTYYNGTGAEPATRMLGVDLNYFKYTYDEQGRMNTVAIYTLGTAFPAIYTISYNEQERYVPLPFPFGKMNFFCIKGVEQITGPAGNISEWKSDNAFVHTQITNAGSLFETRTETVYAYKDTETLFPESATTTMYANEELESTENIHYQWNEKGALLFSKQESYAADGTLEVSVVTNYSKTVPLAPVLARTDAQSYVTEIAYSYDDNGWLKSAIRNLPATDNPENTPKELYEYEETDAQGNWTKSIQKQSEQIDLSHWNGTFYVQRTISYHSGL
jgi:hypothetical protein